MNYRIVFVISLLIRQGDCDCCRQYKCPDVQTKCADACDEEEDTDWVNDAIFFGKNRARKMNDYCEAVSCTNECLSEDSMGCCHREKKDIKRFIEDLRFHIGRDETPKCDKIHFPRFNPHCTGGPPPGGPPPGGHRPSGGPPGSGSGAGTTVDPWPAGMLLAFVGAFGIWFAG